MNTPELESRFQRRQTRLVMSRLRQPGERESNWPTWVGLTLAVLVIVAAWVMR